MKERAIFQHSIIYHMEDEKPGGEMKQVTSSIGVAKTSMNSLVVWNIAKALQSNPDMDLETEIREAEKRLESSARDVSTLLSQYSEGRHLACAVLAWQKLGHKSVDNLTHFAEETRKKLEEEKNKQSERLSVEEPEQSRSISNEFSDIDQIPVNKESKFMDKKHSLMGPVVTLPIQTKIRVETKTSCCAPRRTNPADSMKKIDMVCCQESDCAKQLAQADIAVTELRKRAVSLAYREAQRAELLEKAENAWKDLENGYLRRLRTMEEKEDEIAKQIPKLIEERQLYREACNELVGKLKARGEKAENTTTCFMDLEKEVKILSGIRYTLNEEARKAESVLADAIRKVAKLNRELQVKEEQYLRKIAQSENELEMAGQVLVESERGMKSEISALKNQVKSVSTELLKQETRHVDLWREIEKLEKEKGDLVGDLEECKILCDSKMKKINDDLKQRKEALYELKNKIIECKCKEPVDVTVEVKRTASLVAVCSCSPHDAKSDTCSCTSMRIRLLNDLFSDLFGGLQSELLSTGFEMPCQMLKCLEDNHNWDRSTVVKTNLQDFFTKLLSGELDIAIANSIEKYHAKWVGTSCADLTSNKDKICKHGSHHQKAMECRAQQLATKLAAQLFQDNNIGCFTATCADDALKANDRLIETHVSPQIKENSSAEYSLKVQYDEKCTFSKGSFSNCTPEPSYWQRTHNDVNQLRLEIEDLKKETINKTDLKIMEKNIAKLVQRSPTSESPVRVLPKVEPKTKREKDTKINRSSTTPVIYANNINSDYMNKAHVYKRKDYDCFPNKKTTKNIKTTRKSFKAVPQTFAVNVCLCGDQSNKTNIAVHNGMAQNVSPTGNLELMPDKHLQFNENELINISNTDEQIDKPPEIKQMNCNRNVASKQQLCQSKCVCFNKTPSNTSINKLLETLTKWNTDLNSVNTKNANKLESNNREISDQYNCEEFCMYNKKNIENEIASPGINLLENSSNSKELHFQTLMPNILEKKNSMNNCDCQHDNQQLNFQKEKLKCINDLAFSSERQNGAKCSELTYYDFKVPESFIKQKKVECISEKKEIFHLVCSEDANFFKGNANATVITNTNCVLPNILPRTDSEYLGAINFERINENRSKVNNHEESNSKTDKETKSVPNHDRHLTCSQPCSRSLRQSEKNTPNSTTYSDDHEKDVSPLDFEYNVKFLGVTLTEDNSVGASNNNCTTGENKNVKHQSHNDRGHSCKCDDKIEDLKMYISDALNKLNKYVIPNIDKSHDVQSFQCFDNIDNCGIQKKDLEKSNDFELLRNHLKNRSSNIRLSSQTALTKDQQDKLYDIIFQKVKQVIPDTANNTLNVDVTNPKNEENWNRVYSLLQEYLKAKMKRAQIYTANSQKQTEILPSALKKVFDSIDNDFERVKYISKAKTPVTFEVPVKDRSTESVKELDKNEYIPQKKESVKIKTISKQVSNNSLIVTQNISSQVSHNANENKCCGSSNFQCGDLSTTVSMTNEYNFLIENKDVTTENEQLSKTISKSAQLNVQDMKQQSNPYIGFTVACTCDQTVNSCVCAKSVNKSHGERASAIWRSYAERKNNVENATYLMDNVHNNRSKDDIFQIEPASHINKINESEVESITQTSIQDSTQDDELVLKTSPETDFHQTTNDSTNTSIDVLCNNICTTGRTYTEHFGNVGIHSEDYITFKSKNSKNENSDKDCDCLKVPVCHVKLLIDNIEEKLIRSKCICDSLSSKVCPVHCQ